MTKSEKIQELKEAIEFAWERCKSEPEQGGDRGLCLDIYGYYKNKKLLEQLESEDEN